MTRSDSPLVYKVTNRPHSSYPMASPETLHPTSVWGRSVPTDSGTGLDPSTSFFILGPSFEEGLPRKLFTPPPY